MRSDDGEHDGIDYESLARELSAAVRETVAWLLEHRARDEALAHRDRRRGLLGMGRSPVLANDGRVWRLGVLLLDAEGRLFQAGEVTRAVDPGRPTGQSVAAEARRADRTAAYDGAFEPGEVVNFDAAEFELGAEGLATGSDLIAVENGVVMVRWARGQSRVPLIAYLKERAELLTMRDGWDGLP